MPYICFINSIFCYFVYFIFLFNLLDLIIQQILKISYKILQKTQTKITYNTQIIQPIMATIKSDQIVFPLDIINAKLTIHGLYSFPQQWKTLDDANPDLFTYQVRMSKFQFIKGKICPRQLTQKQKRQQQQKNKKGGKKDSKNPQPNQEQQKLKKLQQERQRQRQQLFAKLSEEQQIYHTAQDIYRAPFLKFQQNTSSSSFSGNDCLILEQRLLKDKGDWLYIYKLPTASQDQLAKMRKTKPKTINNINDINPIIMRAWVSFQKLSSTQTQIKQLRCKIHQVDQTPQTSLPNLQKTYIKISFSVQQPILKQADSYTASSLLNDPQKPKQILPEIKCLQQLKLQLGLAVESLAMEYSTMFWKQINMQEEQRNLSIFLNNKKGEATKRKQQFLYDFNVTGKYKILKDRIKKCIVHICQTKYKHIFAGMKSFNGIKCNNIDQIYSQIYNLLVTSYQETLFKIICQKQQTLQQVLVLNNQTLKVNKQIILNAYKQETIIERVKRTIKQYQVIQDFSYGQKLYQKYIVQYPQITELKYQYGTYCLKYNLRSSKQVFPYIQEYLTKQKYALTQDKKIQFMIILLNMGGQGAVKGWILLRQIIQNQSNSIKTSLTLCRWLLLASVVLKDINKATLSIKYKSYALRSYKKINQNNGTQQNSLQISHKQKPSKTQIPSITGISSYKQQGTPEELIKIYDQLMGYLNKYSAFQLIKKISAQKDSLKVSESNEPKNQLSIQQLIPQLNELLVNSNDETNRARLLQLALKLYNQSDNAQQKNKAIQYVQRAYLIKIINSSSSTQQTQDLKNIQLYLKKSLMTNPDPLSRFTTLLRIGYYGNGRACLLKYLQKSSQHPQYISGLSYKLLGICCLKLNRVDEAIANFKHWNLSDTKNSSAWLYMALAHAYKGKLIVVNQCLNQYKKRVIKGQPVSVEQKAILRQVNDKIATQQQPDQYEKTLKYQILQALA